MKKLNIKKSKGFTLLEVIIAVAISTIVLSGVFGLYNTYQEREKVSDLITDTHTIINMLPINNPSGYGTAGDDITAVSIRQKVIPDTSIVGTSAENSYGGALVILAQVTNADISQAGVEVDGCIAAITNISKNKAVQAITVNTVAMGSSQDVTSSAASAACDADTNTIVFRV